MLSLSFHNSSKFWQVYFLEIKQSKTNQKIIRVLLRCPQYLLLHWSNGSNIYLAIPCFPLIHIHNQQFCCFQLLAWWDLSPQMTLSMSDHSWYKYSFTVVTRHGNTNPWVSDTVFSMFYTVEWSVLPAGVVTFTIWSSGIRISKWLCSSHGFSLLCSLGEKCL